MSRTIARVAIGLALSCLESLPLPAQQQQPIRVQVEGTLTIKKEPTEVGFSSLIRDLQPISQSSRSRVKEDLVLERLRSLLPTGAEFQLDRAIEFRYADVVRTIVFVPVVLHGCPIEFYGFYAFGDSGRGLGFMLSRSSQSSNQFSIRDGSNQGIDIRYDQNGVRDVSTQAPAQSVWRCIGQSLKKRVDVQELTRFGLEGVVCVAMPETCIALAIDVGALVVGVGADCSSTY